MGVLAGPPGLRLARGEQLTPAWLCPCYRWKNGGRETKSFVPATEDQRTGLRAGAQTLPGQVLAEKTSLLQEPSRVHCAECPPVPLALLGLIRPGHNFLMRRCPRPPPPVCWEFLWGWGRTAPVPAGPSTDELQKELSGLVSREALRGGQVDGEQRVAAGAAALGCMGSRGRRGGW